MARYTGASCKQCRREGQKLFLKGERCYSNKCSVDKRPYAPGMHRQQRKNYRNMVSSFVKNRRLNVFMGCWKASLENIMRWQYVKRELLVKFCSNY